MCCGKNRAAARAAVMAAGSARRGGVAHAAAPQVPAIIFEYVGSGTTSIRGPVSGRIYRFARPGDRLRVDPRDSSALAGVASLRWIR